MAALTGNAAVILYKYHTLFQRSCASADTSFCCIVPVHFFWNEDEAELYGAMVSGAVARESHEAVATGCPYSRVSALTQSYAKPRLPICLSHCEISPLLLCNYRCCDLDLSALRFHLKQIVTIAAHPFLSIYFRVSQLLSIFSVSCN